MGHPRSLRQVKSLEAMTAPLSGIASGCEALFADGFERTLTPEIAAKKAAILREHMGMLGGLVDRLERHGRSVTG